jgi:hypothetical protein
MNKLIYAQQSILVFFLFLLVTLQGCKKEETTSSNNNNSNKTIVKYEIISPVPTLPDSTLDFNLGGFNSFVKYTDDYLGGSVGKNVSYSVWTKEIVITQRPFIAFLAARGYVPVTTGGVSMNIYVNGVLKANITAPIRIANAQETVGIFDLLYKGTNGLTYVIE